MSGGRFIALLLLLWMTLSCGATEKRLRVTIVGIDGATWSVIQPMLDRGELPNLAALVKGGASGPLQSEQPLLSPAVWTTIATGVSRKIHGIKTFTGANDQLISSRDRKVPALWTLASHGGLRSAIVGWWATYPAEAINGVVISERALKMREGDIQARFRERELLPPDLARLAHPPEALEYLAATLFEMPERGVDESHGQWLATKARVEDRASAHALMHLREREGPFDLELLLLRGVDPVSHVLWRYHQPDAKIYASLPPMDERAKARFGSPVEDHYSFVDHLLGELGVGPSADRVTLVLSDHGFEAYLPEPGDRYRATGHHKSSAASVGVFAAAGGPLVQGLRVEEALTIYDVTPTVLHLLGLDVPPDLPGRVRLDLFDPDWVESHPLRPRAAFAGPPTDLPLEGDEDADDPVTEARLREELQALGYIE